MAQSALMAGCPLAALALIGIVFAVTRTKCLAVPFALAAVCGISPVSAADCRQFFYKQPVYYAQPIVQKVVYPAVAVSPYLYQAGRDIEADALAAKVAARVIAQLRVEPLTANVPQQQTAPATAVAQHCAKCHSGANPKGGLTYDGVTLLECRMVTAALRAIAADEMPKDHKIPPEVKGQLMSELLSLEIPADRPPPVVDRPPPQPMPEPPNGLK